MRRIGVVLGVATLMVAVVALTAGTALGQSETETVHIRDMTSFIWDNPCTGEEVLFEGDFHNVVHTTVNENGFHFLSRASVQNVTGTGLETGDKYRFVTAGGVISNDSSFFPRGMFINNDETVLLLVSDGDSPNAILHIVLKQTFDEDLQPDLLFQITTVGCTPEVETFRTNPV